MCSVTRGVRLSAAPPSHFRRDQRGRARDTCTRWTVRRVTGAGSGVPQPMPTGKQMVLPLSRLSFPPSCAPAPATGAGTIRITSQQTWRKSTLKHSAQADASGCIDLLYAPLLTPVASRNLLLYQSLPTSIPYRHALVRRRKDDIGVGTASRGIIE
jgi:hypothetical protein